MCVCVCVAFWIQAAEVQFPIRQQHINAERRASHPSGPKGEGMNDYSCRTVYTYIHIHTYRVQASAMHASSVLPLPWHKLVDIIHMLQCTAHVGSSDPVHSRLYLSIHPHPYIRLSIYPPIHPAAILRLIQGDHAAGAVAPPHANAGEKPKPTASHVAQRYPQRIINTHTQAHTQMYTQAMTVQ